MDILTLALAKDFATKVAAGYTSIELDGTKLTFTLNDGSQVSTNLPVPADGKDGANGENGLDGASIENVDINEKGELICYLDNGKTINAGLIPTTEWDLSNYYTKEESDAKFNYTLPVSTSEILGGIKIGAGVNIGEDGTISVPESIPVLVFSHKTILDSSSFVKNITPTTEFKEAVVKITNSGTEPGMLLIVHHMGYALIEIKAIGTSGSATTFRGTGINVYIQSEAAYSYFSILSFYVNMYPDTLTYSGGSAYYDTRISIKDLFKTLNSYDGYDPEKIQGLKNVNGVLTWVEDTAEVDLSDYYTKSEIGNMIAGTFHFKGEKASYEELTALTEMSEGDVYQIGDKEYAYNGSEWVELGFNVDLSDYLLSSTASDTYATKTEINAKANSSDVYNKTETDKLLEAKADASEMDTALAEKADITALNSLEDKVDTKATKATTLVGYDIADAYTKTEVDDLLDSKVNTSSVYTKTQTDELLNAKANTSDVNTALAAKADTTTVSALEETLNNKIDTKAVKATTLSGYGITDAYTKTEVDGMVAGTFHFEGEVASYEALPTDAEKGDVYQVEDKEYAWNGIEWVELGFNIDLSAYLTAEAASATYATISNLATKADSNSVYTKTQTDSLVSAKADKATTLSGYNITDTYTKTAIDGLLNEKANAATTLAEYQISDAYTKTEIDTKVSTINSNLEAKLDINGIIDGGTFE